MRQMNWPFMTLLAWHVFIEPSLARTVPHTNYMTRGQGYNTFEGKGARHGVVKIFRDAEYYKKRDQLTAADPDLTLRRPEEDVMFNFTAPSGDMTGVDIDSYFTPPDPDIIDQAIDGKYGTQQNETYLRGNRNVKRHVIPAMPCSGRVVITSVRVTDYADYLRSLDVSASAVISGWGQSAAISGGYLDEAGFSANTFTYLSTIEVQKQQDPNEAFQFDIESYYREKEAFTKVFGNRWIRGFDKGGKIIIRISVTSKTKGNIKAVGLNAEASFSAFGASGTLSTTAKKRLKKLSRQAKVKIDIYYEGGIGYELKAMSVGDPNLTPVELAIEEAQSWTDKFLEDACKHNYNYRALLEEYRTVPGFPQEQGVWDYDVAERAAFPVLTELVKISELARFIQKSDRFDEQEKEKVEESESDMIEASKKWVRNVAADPTNARASSKALINYFRHHFYTADIAFVSLNR